MLSLESIRVDHEDLSISLIKQDDKIYVSIEGYELEATPRELKTLFEECLEAIDKLEAGI